MPFTEHYMGAEEDGAGDGEDVGPAGGLTWDGRVTRGRDQARIPLLAANEMANGSEAEVARRALAAGYGAALRDIYGPAVERDPAAVFDGVVEAIEAFEQDPATFYPFSSKYDAWLNGTAVLSDSEQRGLAAFDDERRGNCASCHKSGLLANGGHPDFTDFGMVALGLPRNPDIPANADPTHFDLGLCGPARTDLVDHAEQCGRFRVPTLRNVALKRRYFHNGVMTSLRETVRFYADRDLAPEHWFPRDASGAVWRFDDLPPRYRGNVESEPPFDRKPGDVPALSDAEIDDIVAFLGTLTDGYVPTRDAAAKD